MIRAFALATALLPAPLLAADFTAARTLPAGTVLQAGDIQVGDTSDEGAHALVGLQTRVTIYEGKAILPSRLIAPMLIARNQLVTLVYEAPQMRIEAEGRALDEGQAGQSVRVMNLSSRTTVSGQVSPDGSVLVKGN